MEPESGRRRRIRGFVVDDDEAVLGIVGRLAARAGFDVETRANGDARALMQHPADLAMIDLRMPDERPDLLRQIRDAVPSCEVILMTSYAAAVAVEAIKLGAREYLTKPFDIERLQKPGRSAASSIGAPRSRRSRARWPTSWNSAGCSAAARPCTTSSASSSAWRRTRVSCC